MALEAGTRLGTYEILSPLGAGGMGEVYLAKDTTLERKVAIKVLPAEVASRPQRMLRFEQEAKTVAAINHPNIVTIHGIHHENDCRFLAMELVEGTSLDRLIGDGGLPLGRIFDIAIPLADALAAAHDKNIVHRDLKPANVMVTKEGRVKVLDFGLAKLMSGGDGGSTPDDETRSAPLTGQGMIMGTVPYMSPEQLQSEPLDHRTDLFSFGVMLYEMATGQRPFTGKSSVAISSAILRDTPRPLHELNGGLPRHLGRIIEHCLEKDAEHRYQSAKDVRNALRALQKEMESGSQLNEPVPMSSPAAAPPVPTSPSSISGSTLSAPAKRGELWIAVAVLALAILMASWWIGRRDGEKTPTPIHHPSRTVTGTSVGPGETGNSSIPDSVSPTLAILPFENVSTDAETDYLSNEIPASIIDKLARLPDLRVISRSGAFRFDPATADASEFGRSLGASFVLTGQLNAHGSGLTIRAELVDVASNQQLWSERYPRQLADIMVIESEIAQSISDELRIELSSTERTQLSETGTVNADAYRAFLQGRFWWSKFTPEGYRRAVTYYHRAIEEDPAYAAAYAGLANTYSNMGGWFGDMSPNEAFPKAREAATKAIELNPALSDARRSLAFIKLLHDWDWQGAEEEFKEALRLDPGSAGTLGQYAVLLHLTGKPERAQELRKRAIELDPSMTIVHAALAWGHLELGEFEDAIRRCDDALRLDPEFPPALGARGFVHLAHKEYDKAVAVLKQATHGNRNTSALGWLGLAYAQAGDRSAALETLTLIESHRGPRPRHVSAAIIHGALGNLDRAFELLELAFEARDTNLVWLATAVHFESLRGDPRFDDLVRKIGLPSASKPPSESRAPTEKTKVAILPFDDHSPKPQPWLASGMAADISAQLGRVNPAKLGVLGPETTSFYAQRDRPIQDLREDLGVVFILRGDIQNVGDDVRITARLIRADDRTQVWSAVFTGTLDEPFALQSMVANRIIGGLPIELTGEEQTRLENPYVPDPTAQIAYLQGRHFAPWDAGGVHNLEKAIEYFEEAIRLDPQYALPYCGLVDAKCFLTTWGKLQTRQIRSEMEATVGKALALDNTLPEVHVSAGVAAEFVNWNWSRAEASLERAIQLDPNHARAYLEYGHLLLMLGRYDEAKRQFERAIRLNPKKSEHHAGLGKLHVGTGQLGKAEPFLLDAFKLNSDSSDANVWLADLRQKQGRYDEAVAIMESFVLKRTKPEPAMRTFLGNAYVLAGRIEDARNQLAEMKDSVRTGHHMWFGELHAALGETEEAFRRLNQALEEREGWLPHIRFDPGLIEIRSDSRFAELHRKMGLDDVDLSYADGTP